MHAHALLHVVEPFIHPSMPSIKRVTAAERANCVRIRKCVSGSMRTTFAKRRHGRPKGEFRYYHLMNRSIWTLRFRWWPWFGPVRAVGRAFGDNKHTRTRRPTGVQRRPKQLPSFSAGRASIETNPRTLSRLSTTADPLVALDWAGMVGGLRGS